MKCRTNNILKIYRKYYCWVLISELNKIFTATFNSYLTAQLRRCQITQLYSDLQNMIQIILSSMKILCTFRMLILIFPLHLGQEIYALLLIRMIITIIKVHYAYDSVKKINCMIHFLRKPNFNSFTRNESRRKISHNF